MADTKKLRIDVDVATGAAQDALRDLANTQIGARKAADEHGDALKRTAAITADATAKTAAAREATARAAKALNEHNAVVNAFGKDSAEAAASLNRLRAEEEAAAKAAREAERAIEGAARAVAETAANADEKATPALKRMRSALETAGKSADATASDLRALEARIESASGGAKGFSATLSSFKGNVAAMAVGALADRLGDLGLHALGTAASFESMKTALASTLGSQDEAIEKFAELQKFAAATPFSLEEATQGFLKLKNLGLDASTRAMTAYGDMAGATGKTMMDVVEAVADAAQGEGERLKELGIRMSKDGDRIRLTFRGMTEEMKFDSQEIEQYLIRLGETNFAGGMLAQSKTLGGLWSTMKDGFDQFIVGVMDSGVTAALKDIMGTFSGMSETGELLATVLGGGLGLAFEALALSVKVAAGAIELFSTATNAVLTPIELVKDAARPLADDIFDAVAVAARSAADAEAELGRQYQESAKGTGTLMADMLGLVDVSREYASSVLAEAEAQLAAAGAAERRAAAEQSLWDKLAKRNAAAEDKAIEEAFFAANAMGPELPPGFDRKKGKGKKSKQVEATSRDIDFWAGAGASVGVDIEGQAAAFEQESALREARLAGLSTEIELLEARGVAESEQFDLVFMTLEIESEAARQREQLLDQRLAAEEKLAQWQAKHAVTQEQREKAQTRLEQVEHAKRLQALRRAADEESKTHRQREKVVGMVAGAVTQLGEGMVDALQRAAEGEKGAVAAMVKELLAGVAKKHAVLALAETALAVGSAASFNYPAAAAHGAAALLHGGVAIAAGAGAVAAGAIAEARQAGGPSGSAAFGAARPGAGSSSGPRGGGSSSAEDVEQLEVPISEEQMRRGDPSVRRAPTRSSSTTIVVQGPVVGERGMEELANIVARHQDKANRSGRRPRP